MKLVDTDTLMPVLLHGIYHPETSLALISALISRPYCMTDITVPIRGNGNAEINMIMDIIGCSNIINWHSLYESDRSNEITFENADSDFIHLEILWDYISICIFSTEQSLRERYAARIAKIMDLTCADKADWVSIKWRCYLINTNRDYLNLTMKLPRDYEKTIPLSNYALDTQVEIQKLEEALTNGSYYGQLIVLEGEPGTGKSYYVRRLVSMLYQAQAIRKIFYYLGRGVEAVDVDHCINNNLLIFEDSDYILRKDVQRNSDVNKILNFSSGFVDTKALFIFTTNLEVGEMDPAFMRDGRLMARIKFGTFSRIEAQNWLASRNCEIELEDGEYTLANLYARLKQFNKICTKHVPSTIGFRRQ